VKRFWNSVAMEPSEQGYAILLGGRPMRLPGGAVLRIRGEALALAVAAEWEAADTAKGGEMSFADPPLTQLAGTAQERIARDPWPIVDAIARYGETDMLCYRAEGPESLVRRQRERWDPWLDWLARRYSAPLRVVTGVGPVKQHRGSIVALRAAVGGFNAYGLAGMGVAVPALGSLVLGLALAEGELDAAEAHELGALDELYQVEKWGEDAEAAARRASIAEDIAVAARFMALARA
jgi:chaperone required for assembly of F1-ATPase